MDEKIRIAMVTNHFGITGISTVILNYCKELDNHKYDLTVIAGQPIDEENRKECIENDIHLIELPSRHHKPIKHYIGLWKVLKKNHYDIIHVHGSSSMMAIELTIAKACRKKNRIAHSHNSMCPNMKIHRILNPYFKLTYTKALACGKLAGDWLFGENKFEILPNAFRTDIFEFNCEGRFMIRKKLNIEDKFVIGHIGRFNEQKNQEYLLKVFEKVASKRKDAVLLMVGMGPDYKKIGEQVSIHPYKNRIILYGETSNPTEMYSAMDVFVFPSRYEGLPVVLLEAQISGLPCIVSDKVTQEVNFGQINWRSIDEEPDQWANVILKINGRSQEERISYRTKYLNLINRYEIKYAVMQLDSIYMKMIKKGI